MRGGETLAHLTPDGLFLVPEIDGHFTLEAACTTTAAFEPLRSLFEREVQLLDADSDQENSEWDAIWEELQEPGLWVESVDGMERYAILWIHFREGRAWWWPLYNAPVP